MSALPKYPDKKGLEKEIRFCTFEPVGSRQQWSVPTRGPYNTCDFILQEKQWTVH